jgi:hypothetical protein
MKRSRVRKGSPNYVRLQRRQRQNNLRIYEKSPTKDEIKRFNDNYAKNNRCYVVTASGLEPQYVKGLDSKKQLLLSLSSRGLKPKAFVTADRYCE